MPRRRPRRSRRAPTSVDDALYPTLDLHGESAEAARRRAELWLRARAEENVRTVRVITGRGLHSVGPPVLPGEIEALLGELKGGVVSSFAREPGGGAYRIELRRISARDSGVVPAADPFADSLRGVDSELRRRAEEALWELGVAPTPELIRAEIRRLLDTGK
ncbi:MAG TPA: Smr/MutS family protein [Longimicrobiaceae bacterium]|nr:Smr/MutS family protein [Longimicrobiaceae bacterium]